MTQAQMLGGQAVAARLGISRAEASRWRSVDWEQYGFPAPDGRIGGQPWWWSTTIDAWAAKSP